MQTWLSEIEVADVLSKVREAATLGELDTLIEQQALFGRRVTLAPCRVNIPALVFGRDKVCRSAAKFAFFTANLRFFK